MIKAVLLDLDNTLLNNPDRQFAIAFLETFDKHFESKLKVQSLSRYFREGIKLLSTSRDITHTNTQAMLSLFSQKTQITTERLQETLLSFYEDRYLALQHHTKPVAGSQELITALLKQNIAVAIATNPIYPRQAITQRLEWADLLPYRDEFAFITHSDNMHFSKPHPAYYAELIARIGVEPDEALMIGDSQVNDIQPAAMLGIHTKQVTQLDPLAKISEHVQESADWKHRFERQPLSPNMIQPQYEGNIGALYGLLSEVKENQWLQKPDPTEWSIIQILCHLYNSEIEVQRPRLEKILTHDNPFITSPPLPGPDIEICNTHGYTIADNFRHERLTTINSISQITAEQWNRPARHSIFGMTTLLEMAHFTAQHDRLHLTQLCQTLGKCN